MPAQLLVFDALDVILAPGSVRFLQRSWRDGAQFKHFRLFFTQTQVAQRPLLLQAQQLTMPNNSKVPTSNVQKTDTEEQRNKRLRMQKENKGTKGLAFKNARLSAPKVLHRRSSRKPVTIASSSRQ